MKFSKTFALKLGIVFLFCSLLSFSAQAQLAKKSKVFLSFENTEGEIDVKGDDALKILNSYLKEKTNCVVVDKQEAAEYVFKLRVVEQSLGDRKAKLEIHNSKTNELVSESKWLNGTSNSRYGFSGSRHSICRTVKNFLLLENEKLKKIE